MIRAALCALVLTCGYPVIHGEGVYHHIERFGASTQIGQGEAYKKPFAAGHPIGHASNRENMLLRIAYVADDLWERSDKLQDIILKYDPAIRCTSGLCTSCNYLSNLTAAIKGSKTNSGGYGGYIRPKNPYGLTAWLGLWVYPELSDSAILDPA